MRRRSAVSRAALAPLMMVLVACGGRPSDAPGGADSAFAGVQARGRVAMGVDQYTSTHVFEPLPDGGRIALERDADDPAGTAEIRRHIAEIAVRFAAGNFELPGFVHARTVPGTAVMAAKRDAISYRVDTLPRGAVLRIRTADAAAVAAIHQFLAFQRQDHHAGSTHGT